MNREPVASEALSSVGYDSRTRTLEVEFRSGEVYRYLDVDAADAKELFGADSLGRHLNQHIKPRHRFVHVDAA